MTTLAPAPTTEPGIAPHQKKSLSAMLNGLAHHLAHPWNRGISSELRRRRPDDIGGAAFYRVAADFLEPEGWLVADGQARDTQERTWGVLLNGLAIVGGLHQPNCPLGEALARAGFSEIRFVKLLNASGKSLHTQVSTAARFLAAKGEPVDWTDMAHLVLSEEAEWAEKVRRRIARGYYRALAQDHPTGASNS